MRVAGVLRPPGDKSITHRALMLASLASGPCELSHVLTGADARSTARALRLLGASVGPLRPGRAVRVRGARWTAPARTLQCGNSGTTARLLLGLLAGHPFETRLTGDASLRRRPMRRVAEPLRAMGAEIREVHGDGLPLAIRGGRLRPISYESPLASAQVKSAVLLAGLVAGVEVTVREPACSRDHTERLLGHLGFDVRVRGATVTFRPPPASSAVPPFRLDIPADMSSATFLVVVAALAEGGELVLENVGVNPTRTGALDVLARMGVHIERRDARTVSGEPVADLVVRPGDLTGTEVTAAEVPRLIDEVPPLAVLASRARGETRFRAVGELRVKESDRLTLLARNLRAVGAEAAVEGDDLVVAGGAPPPVGRVETGRDHRIAMAFAVLGTAPGARVSLSETASPAVSYPAFFEDLHRIAADG